MKICKICKHKNGDEANFCQNCGARFTYTCSGCGIPEQCGNFCCNCGKALHPSETPAQENNLENGAPMSAFTYVQPQRNVVPSPAYNAYAHVYARPAKPRKTAEQRKAFTDKIAGIVRAGAILLLTVISFILSFFSVVTIDGSVLSGMSGINLGPLDEVTEKMAIDISATDIIEGAFLTLSPKTEEELTEEFLTFAQENVTESEYDLLASDIDEENIEEAIALVCRLVEDFNVLKFCIMESALEGSPSTVLSLWVAMAFIFAEMGLLIALLAVASVSLVKALTGKQKQGNGLFTLATVTAACTLAFVFVQTKLCFYGSVTGGCARAVMILCLIGAAIGLAYRFVTAEIRLKKEDLFSYVSAAVGAALCLALLFMCCGDMLAVTAKVGTRSYKAQFGVASMIEGWNMMKLAQQDETLFGSVLTQIPLYTSSGLASVILNPAYAGVLGFCVLEQAFTALGILTFFCDLVLMVALAFGVVSCVNTFAYGKKPSLVYAVLIPLLPIVTLTFTAIIGGMANYAMFEEGAEIEYASKITALFVFTLIFAVLYAAQFITFRILDKKMKKVSISEPTVASNDAPAFSAPAETPTSPNPVPPTTTDPFAEVELDTDEE